MISIFLTDPAADTFAPFEHDGIKCTFAQIGASGLNRLVDGQLWIFVDWVLQDISGLELCRRLRAASQTSEAHITIVLDENSTENRKRALDAGADDYIIGPIDRHKVLDRVLALNPGKQGRFATDHFERGKLKIDIPAHRAYWDGKALDISPNEFRLLRFLAENANQVLTREEILEGLQRGSEEIDERTVDVWIGRLRRPIRSVGGGNPLRTVRSVGYVFDLE